MKKKLMDEFNLNHQLWISKTRELKKMEEDGGKNTSKYKTLKKEANGHYKIAVSLLNSAKEKLQSSILSNPKLLDKTSVLSMYLLDELTLSEEGVMNIIWKATEPVKFDQIAKLVAGQPTIIALQNSLKSLDAKEFIKSEDGLYTAIVTEPRYHLDILQKIAILYFNSSFTELGTFLVEKGEFGHRELEGMINKLGEKINK